MLLSEATFATSTLGITKPRKKKLVGLGSAATSGAISGGGTGALVGLLAKHSNSGFQRNAAAAGAAIGAGMSIAKKLKSTKPKTPKIPKPKKTKTI